MKSKTETKTSIALIFVVTVVLAWMGWKQLQSWYKPRQLPNFVHQAFRNSDDIILHAISPKHPPANPNGYLFHGFESLGTMRISNSTAKSLINSIDNNVNKSDLRMVRCFYPRHGLSCEYQGDTVDILICFQCRYLYIYKNGELEFKDVAFGESPKSQFDKLLLSKNLPVNVER